LKDIRGHLLFARANSVAWQLKFICLALRLTR